jgi:tryptophan synthase beta chain
VRYESATDAEALEAFQALSRLEGIIPALEPAHALAWMRRSAGRWPPDSLVLVCLSGRGDKDVAHAATLLRSPA